MSGSELILAFLIIGLLLAVLIDIREHRIPNWLVFCLVFGGGALQFWFYQWHGLLTSFLGLTLGLSCFLPFHLFGAMGAGDVKLLAATGVLLGPSSVGLVAVMTIIVGGFIALLYIGIRGGLQDLVRRYYAMLVLLICLKPQYIPPAPGEAAGQRFPYALAIASGTMLVLSFF